MPSHLTDYRFYCNTVRFELYQYIFVGKCDQRIERGLSLVKVPANLIYDANSYKSFKQ